MAVQMARKASARFDLILLTDMTDKSIDRAKLHQIIRKEFELYLKEHDWKNRHEFDEERDERNEKLLEGGRELLRYKSWQDAAVNVDLALRDEELELEFGSPEYKELAMGFLRANVEAMRISAARFRGDYTAKPEDPLFLGRYVEPELETLSVADACEQYITDRIAKRGWRKDQQKEARNTLKLFQEYVGDARLASIDKRKVNGFSDLVHLLPVMRGKSNELRGLNTSQLVELVKKGEIQAIGPTTVGKHMRNLNAFFEWALRRAEIPANPCVGVYEPQRATHKKSDEVNGWSEEQLRILFSCPIYHGRKSEGRRFTVGTMRIKDDWYWMPLFLAFHPIRPEEIAQIQVADIFMKEGVLGFQIEGGVTADEIDLTGKKVKNVLARRFIPIHHLLLELGLEQILSAKKRTPNERFFSSFKAQGHAQRYSQYFCRFFNEQIKGLGISGVSTYGLRHTSITALAQNCHDVTLRRHLQGHAQGVQDDRYIKGVSVTAAKAAIDSIQYPGIDADFIRGA